MRYSLYFFSYNDRRRSFRTDLGGVPDGFFYLNNDEFRMKLDNTTQYYYIIPVYRNTRFRLWRDGIYELLEPQRTFTRNAFFVPETHPFFNIYVVDRVVLGDGREVKEPLVSKDHPTWKQFDNLLRNYFQK